MHEHKGDGTSDRDCTSALQPASNLGSATLQSSVWDPGDRPGKRASGELINFIPYTMTVKAINFVL